MFLPVDGGLLNTVELGSGPATFVAHGGWVGNWELWQEPLRLMHRRWRCIAYDHRGSGATTFPPEAISPTALVDDLFHVLDRLEVETCVLAGESLGALTCALAVLRDPARFDGLVLVDGVAAASEQAMKPLVDGSRSDYPATVHAFAAACVPDPSEEHIRRWARQILLRAEPEAAARILESHYEQGIAPEHSRISVPTLLVHGDNDLIVPLAVAQSVAAAMPDAELVVLPGAGHVPTMTQPERVVEALERWAAQPQR